MPSKCIRCGKTDTCMYFDAERYGPICDKCEDIERPKRPPKEKDRLKKDGV